MSRYIIRITAVETKQYTVETASFEQALEVAKGIRNGAMGKADSHFTKEFIKETEVLETSRAWIEGVTDEAVLMRRALARQGALDEALKEEE